MPPPEKFETTVIIRECNAVYNGSRGGRDFTIYQIVATKPDGTEIDNFKLRSFQELPLNQPIEVKCTLFKSEEYGDSYTVEPKQKLSNTQLLREELQALATKVEQDHDRLVDRILALEGKLNLLVQQVQELQPNASPEPAPQAEAPAPVDPMGGGIPGDDDIPF
jgi:hypothetical protein